MWWYLLLLLPGTPAALNTCAPRHITGPAQNYVCVCNSSYCDDFPRLEKLNDGTAAVYTSSLSGKRFDLKFAQFGVKSTNTTGVTAATVKINPQDTYQSIIGFGGAFTDSVGFNLNSLTPIMQYMLLDSYFGKQGLEYNLGRVPMASCDFSMRTYSYLDTSDDFELKSFNLTSEDFDYKIPFIDQAVKMTEGKLKLMASVWSAPGWMKTNGKMVGGAPLKGEMGGIYYQTWGKYFIRFLEEYHKNGVDFWGLTVQNEPSSGLDPNYAWQTMYLSAETERDFVKTILGPLLRNSSHGKNINLMCMDDQRFLLPTWADTIFADPDAAQYIDGIAVHWYEDFITPAHNLQWTHERHPDKFMLATEACNGYLPFTHGPILGDWSRGESYAHDIIQDLNNYMGGWIDWNLCLDMKGGPNFAKNFVDAPIIVNAEKGEFYKQPMFYVMGHFSKFLKPHSVRIGLNIDANANLLEGVAVSTATNQRVIVLINRHDDVSYSAQIEDAANPGQFLNVYVEPHSIHTIVWNKVQAL